jgi:hypothetical protein
MEKEGVSASQTGGFLTLLFEIQGAVQAIFL